MCSFTLPDICYFTAILYFFQEKVKRLREQDEDNKSGFTEIRQDYEKLLQDNASIILL